MKEIVGKIKRFWTPRRQSFVSAKTVILMYHRILPDRGEDSLHITVTLKRFRSHLDVLNRHFNVIRLDELVERLDCGDLLPRSVVITFDDGYCDGYEYAFPALKAAALTATYFLPTDYMGQSLYLFDERLRFVIENSMQGEFHIPNRSSLPLLTSEDRHQAVHCALRFLHTCSEHEKEAWLDHWKDQLGAGAYVKEPIHLPLNWEQINEMHGQGMIIGSHGSTHRNLAALSEKDLKRETQGSARIIEQHVGKIKRFFSFPYGRPGDVTAKVVNAVRNAGYLLACTASRGPVFHDSEPFLLRRMEVVDWPEQTFIDELEKTFRMEAPAEEFYE